jgi:hypothetical protein
VGAQEVRWDKGGTVRAENYKFFLWKRRRKSTIETGDLYNTEYYWQLRQQSLLAIGVHTEFWEVAGVISFF